MFKVPTGLYKASLVLCVFWLSIGVLFNLLRLVSPHIGLDQLTVGSLANIISFFMFILAFTGFFAYASKKLKIKFFTGFILLFILFSLCVGVLNNGLNLATFKHLYLFLFVIVFLEVGYKLSSEFTIKRIRAFSIFSFYVNLISIPLFTYINHIWKLYPGYGVQSMAYVSIYFYLVKNRLGFLLSSLIIISQGKRSIIVGVFLSICIHQAIIKTKSKYGLMLGLIFLVLLTVFGLYIIDYTNSYDLFGLSRMKYISPFSDSFDIYIGSSGRVDEFISVLLRFENVFIPKITGFGMGFEYEWLLSYRKDFSEIKSYLHNSPLMISILLGPFIAVALYWYFLKLISWGFNSSGGLLINYISLCSLCFLILGLFSLNMLSDPIGWVLIGVLLSLKEKNVFLKKY